MACGTPVIVSNGGSLPEVVGQAGEIVEYQRTDLKERLNELEFTSRLTATILKVLGDEPLRRAMGQAGVERALNNNWGNVAASTIKVYERAIGKR